MTIKAATKWKSNAELIEACAELGYLQKDWMVLDPTYGKGTFWKKWRPNGLVAHDIDPKKSPHNLSVDFTDLPYGPKEFDAVVFDAPFKLNGKSVLTSDGRYGVDVPMRWQERHNLMRAGMLECIRVLKPKGFLLMKCQDQVSSGKVRWQTMEFTAFGESNGLELVDMLHLLGGRPQPGGRRQVHARRNLSTMLILRKISSF